MGDNNHSNSDRNSYTSQKNSYGSSRDDGGEKANEVLGGLFTVPDNLLPMLNPLKDTIRPLIVEKGESIVKTGVLSGFSKIPFLKNFAEGASNKAGAVVAYGLIFSDQLAGSWKNLIRYKKGKEQLAEDLAPMIKAEGETDLLSGLLGNKLANNEVFQDAKADLKRKWWQDTVADLTGLVSALPALYIRAQKAQQHRSEEAASAPHSEDEAAHRTEIKRRRKHVETELEEYGVNLEDKEAVSRATQRAEERFDKLLANEATRKQVNHTQHEEGQDNINKFLVPSMAVLAEGLRGHFVGKEKLVASKDTVSSMLKKLSDTVIDDKEATGVNGVPYDAYIRKIFDTHQDAHHAKIGKRFDEKMNYACKEIAKAITEGKMHPMAVGFLVGDHLIVQDSGKKIASREEIKTAIDAMIEKMPAKFAVDPDEYFSEAAVSEEKFKAKLEGLHGEAKELFVAAIPREVAKKIGADEESIEAAHKKMTHGEKAKALASAVLDLNTLSDDQLKNAGQDAKEIKLIRALADAAKEGRHDELMEAVTIKGQFKGKLDTVVAAAMAEGLIGTPGDLYAAAQSKEISAALPLAEAKPTELGADVEAETLAEHKDETSRENHFDHDDAHHESFDMAEEMAEKPHHHITGEKHHHGKNHHHAEEHHGMEMD